MNIFGREMRANRKSLIFWIIGMLFMISSGMSKYVSMSGTDASMNDLMADMPKSIQAIMGTGVFDLSKASGYYGVLFIYLLVMATIHAAIIGANIISKEERDKTSEFLFVKPLSRKRIITSKLLAALVNIMILNIVTAITSILIVIKYGNGESVTQDIILLMIGMFHLQLLFLGIGSFFAAVLKKTKKAQGYATGLLLFTFMLSIAIDLDIGLDILVYLTPFKYFDAKNIMYGGGLSFIFITLSITLTIVLIILTYVFYQKRDLKV